MSTHHTLVLSTQQSLTPATWNQLFEDAGGTMNLAWTDFEPSEVLEESADKRVVFFWTRGGEMSHWATRLHEGLQQQDPTCSVEYFFDMTGEMHGYWQNGRLKVEPYTPFYEVVLSEYTPLTDIVHNEENKFFSVLYGGEVILLTYTLQHKLSTHTSDFSELKRGVRFDCKTPEGQPLWVILYDGNYYSEDIEHGQI